MNTHKDPQLLVGELIYAFTIRLHLHYDVYRENRYPLFCELLKKYQSNHTLRIKRYDWIDGETLKVVLWDYADINETGYNSIVSHILMDLKANIKPWYETDSISISYPDEHNKERTLTLFA